jgi:hypothetical protein
MQQTTSSQHQQQQQTSSLQLQQQQQQPTPPVKERKRKRKNETSQPAQLQQQLPSNAELTPNSAKTLKFEQNLTTTIANNSNAKKNILELISRVSYYKQKIIN